MGILSGIFPFLTWAVIRSYKLIEFQVLRLFSSSLKERVENSFRRGGIQLVRTKRGSSTENIVLDPGMIKMEVYTDDFYVKIANHASLAMGEGFMNQEWFCDDMFELSHRYWKSELLNEYFNPWNRFLNYMEMSFFNLQNKENACDGARQHYDLGNDLFETFLDPYMQYTCGYWPNAKSLDEAQLHKMELIAKKLKLKPGMRVLDLGCGWGGLCKYLAEKHGVECVGVNIAEEGIKYGRTACEGLPVEFRLTDYRNIDEKFDRVVSVGMLEHVGAHNHREFFQVVNRCLKDDGISLIHAIGRNSSKTPGNEPFFHKYIFPFAHVPYYRAITKATEDLFVIEDWHNFNVDYYKTLVGWKENFDKGWPELQEKYGERFYRLWTFYLTCSGGAFSSRKYQLWQVVLSKNGVEGGYESVR